MKLTPEIAFECEMQAQREVYWRALMRILAERAIRFTEQDRAEPGTLMAEWEEMERDIMRRNWRLWREACEAQHGLEASKSRSLEAA